MNVISRRKLKQFCQSMPEHKRHEAAFDMWYKLARRARWENFEDAKATFGQTDVAKGYGGRTATIFDIGGNKYRVLAHIDYARQTVKIEAILDHREYDKNLWKKLF